MDTPRPTYKIDEENPGSDLTADTVAAFSAASMTFAPVYRDYAYNLLTHAKQLFVFARDYNGLYQPSITGAGEFYLSSGYQEELFWAASWLYRAISNKEYLDFLSNQNDDGGTRTMFLWDDKYVGVQVLAAKLVLEGKVKPADDYKYGSAATWADDMKTQAEQFIRNCLQKGDNNIKYDTRRTAMVSTFLYRRVVQPSALLGFARPQVDYILGSNPKNMSCMVGFGSNYPTQVHHRGASIVSVKQDPTHVSCKAGYDLWFNKNLIGGPDQNDGYTDSRSNFQMAEPTTVTTASLFSVLARLA
ncbi:Glycoside hydrolase [Parasponia andersonii]|uniref:cellulase n=1 Tax=Parasponia andersonii TaxID=3476 RepID=A0A2P5CHN5_PARAD|nr:Glycoside hydrolase [Parasponia andersonii]